MRLESPIFTLIFRHSHVSHGLTSEFVRFTDSHGIMASQRPAVIQPQQVKGQPQQVKGQPQQVRLIKRSGDANQNPQIDCRI